MREQESINILMNHTQHFVPNDDLEALYMAVESLDRDVARTPIETQELCDIEWLCPKCKVKVGDIVNVSNYCSNCGQKILFNK